MTLAKSETHFQFTIAFSYVLTTAEVLYEGIQLINIHSRHPTTGNCKYSSNQVFQPDPLDTDLDKTKNFIQIIYASTSTIKLIASSIKGLHPDGYEPKVLSSANHTKKSLLTFAIEQEDTAVDFY